MGKYAQLYIDNGIQLVERRAITVANSVEQSADCFVRPRVHRSIRVDDRLRCDPWDGLSGLRRRSVSLSADYTPALVVGLVGFSLRAVKALGLWAACLSKVRVSPSAA
jgi:hypothetical protein